MAFVYCDMNVLHERVHFEAVVAVRGRPSCHEVEA